MKYIDAEKLIERLEEIKRAEYENCGGVNSKTGALQEVQDLITSLQQEQPEEAYIFKPNMTIDEMKYSINEKQWELEKESGAAKEVDEDFFFDEVLKVYDDNNKYPPRSEEELTMLEIIARHFYELGINARKEE